jgi:DNA-binding XRE family transcriptional regulator
MNKLDLILKEKGISRAQLAEAVGVTPMTINNICNGRVKILFPTVCKISEFLSLKIEDIWEIKEVSRQ